MNLSSLQRYIINFSIGVLLVKSCAGGGLTTALLGLIYKFIAKGMANKIAVLDCNFHASSLNQQLTERYGKHAPVKAQTVDGFCMALMQSQYRDYGLLQTREIKQRISEYAKEKRLDKQVKKELFKSYCSDVESGNSSVSSVLARLNRYKSNNKLIDYADAYNYFYSNPSVLKKLVGHYSCVVIDNLHNVSERQARFIRQLCNIVPLVIMGGDTRQSIQPFGKTGPKYWEYLEKQLRPKCITISLPVIKQSGFNNAIANSIEETCLLSAGKKPIYRSFDNAESQHNYLSVTIEKLLKSGVKASDIAVLSRTRASLLNVKLALNSEFIQTNDSFVRAKQVEQSFELFRSLISIVHWQATEQSFPASDFQRLLEFVGIEAIQRKDMLNDIREHGINAFRVSRNQGRIDSDNILMLQQAIINATEQQYPETGIQILLDGLQPFIRKHLDYPAMIMGLLSRIKVIARDVKTWSDINLLVITPDSCNTGITLMTCNKAVGRQWKHVFIIDVVDTVFPFIKYDTSEEAIETELRLFYSSITRATKQLYLLRSPVNKLHFKKSVGSNIIAHSHEVAESEWIKVNKKLLQVDKRNEKIVQFNYHNPPIF